MERVTIIFIKIFELFKFIICVLKKDRYIENSNVETINGGYAVTVWDGTVIFVSNSELHGEEELVDDSNDNSCKVILTSNKNISEFKVRVNYQYT